ncbi:MAG TPA: FGGY family carbohydrate kinase [Bryobacteraceae bacterium]|nr:FGGY family carbohydrate kinase [Bryobacteraceae bacterium]
MSASATEPCLVGLDLGSSAVKAGVFSPDGRTLAAASVEVPTCAPRPGWKEQDPECWWRAACSALRQSLAAAPTQRVAALGATGHVCSLTFLDEQGAPVRPAIVFQDQRAIAEVDELSARFSRAELAAALGVDLPPSPAWPLPRLLWFRKHEPATLARARRLVQAKDYVNFRLTARLASDAASNRGLVDLETGAAACGLLEAFDLPSSLVPEILAPQEVLGRVAAEAAAETGLPAGTPVVTGWNDLNAAVLGAGNCRDGDAFNVTGTSEHLGLTVAGRPHSPVLTCAPYLPGLRLFYGVTTSGGGSLEWFRRVTGEPLDELVPAAGGVTAGAQGLLFLPYLAGERAPIWDPRASGAFIGIRNSHARPHFTRAVLEGVAFSLRQIAALAWAASGRRPESVRVCGGASRLRLWNQIKADVLETEIAVPECPHAGALGAAMLAAVGTGAFPDFPTAIAAMTRIQERLLPRARESAIYRELYEIYCELYPALRASFARLHAHAGETDTTS